MTADFSWLHEAMPIFGFVLVFVLAYAVFAKTKILGESKAINVIISFILSIIFLSFSQVRNFVTNITPWMVVLLVLSFFFLMITAFLIKDPASFNKGYAIATIVLFILIVIIALFYSFPNTQAYLPGASEAEANGFLLGIKHFILGSKFLNSLLLLIIAVVVGVIITKS